MRVIKMSEIISILRKILPILVIVFFGCTILGIIFVIIWQLSFKSIVFLLMALLMLLATLGVLKEEPPIPERLVIEWLACCIIATSIIVLAFIFG